MAGNNCKALDVSSLTLTFVPQGASERGAGGGSARARSAVELRRTKSPIMISKAVSKIVEIRRRPRPRNEKNPLILQRGLSLIMPLP
jgi:hypothetical protein